MDDAINIRFCPNVDAFGRLIQQYQIGVLRNDPGEQNFLLIAAGKRFNRSAQRSQRIHLA
ncbi:hypothetical protein D3C87_1504030 [compost metagenome]